MTIWPTSIPLPFLDFSGAPRTTTEQSSGDNGLIVRRSRFTPQYVNLIVTWILRVDEHAAFQTFFQDTLNEGCSLFSIELRYPKNSVLTEWVARFVDGYEARWADGAWVVRAELDLVREAAVSSQALLPGASLFFVMSEITGEDPEDFFTVDEVAFVAKGEDS